MSVQRVFTWSETDEPHATRRLQILKKYPEIKDLFGKETRTLPLTALLVALQWIGFYLVRDLSWGYFFLVTYAFSGTFTHSLNLSIHELCHNLWNEDYNSNRWLSVFANLGTGIPSAITFTRYHLEHHKFQGVDGMDVDIPSQLEVNVFTNTILKTLWVLMQPLFYAFRPLIMKPKSPTFWEGVNYAVVLSFDFTVLYFFGLKSLLYLVVGTLLGAGLHPCAGHFIAEHYQFIKGQETYSYYGPCNLLNFNVGYHNEHHDFPKIPWSNLPKVRQIAPEFYQMPHYTSYIAVIFRYITDPEIGPFSRVKRQPQKPRAKTAA